MSKTDTQDESRSIVETISRFRLRVLYSWKIPAVSGVVLFGLAIYYGMFEQDMHLLLTAVIAGHLAFILASYSIHRMRRDCNTFGHLFHYTVVEDSPSETILDVECLRDACDYDDRLTGDDLEEIQNE